MKRYFIALSAAALAGMMILGFGCDKEKGKEPTPAPTPGTGVKSLTVAPAEMALKVGEEKAFTVTVDPAGAKVEYTIDNKEVISLNDKKIKALKEGKAVVTAKAGDKTATISVTVTATGGGGGDGSYDATRVVSDLYLVDPANGYQKEPILAAMDKLGWLNKAITTDPEQKVAWGFVQKEGTKDQHIFAVVHFYHTPRQGAKFSVAQAAFRPGAWATVSAEKGGILERYGFTEGYKSGKLQTGEFAAMGTNPKLNMQALLYMEPKKAQDGTDIEVVTLQFSADTRSQSRSSSLHTMTPLKYSAPELAAIHNF